MSEGVVWEKVVWRHGDGRYTFEVDRGGLHATLSSPHGPSLTIPVVAWYGLLDALAASRRTHARAARPAAARHGERWSTTETEEMIEAHRAGVSTQVLAERHSRSRAAIEAQLARTGAPEQVEFVSNLLDEPGGGVVPAAPGSVPGREHAPCEPPWPTAPWPEHYPRDVAPPARHRGQKVSGDPVMLPRGAVEAQVGPTQDSRSSESAVAGVGSASASDSMALRDHSPLEA